VTWVSRVTLHKLVSVDVQTFGETREKITGKIAVLSGLLGKAVSVQAWGGVSKAHVVLSSQTTCPHIRVKSLLLIIAQG